MSKLFLFFSQYLSFICMKSLFKVFSKCADVLHFYEVTPAFILDDLHCLESC